MRSSLGGAGSSCTTTVTVSPVAVAVLVVVSPMGLAPAELGSQLQQAPNCHHGTDDQTDS